ncbi:MAG: iron transporter FeoA [Candidatus Binatia bacterium]|nr:MAG: iron transporter FeoA [Candidatus Binatia bacterium]
MERTLADLRPDQEARIRGLLGSNGITQRLAELGFTPGQKVRVVRYAPLGDPMQVRLRGFDLAVRRNEARRVLLEAE